MNADERGSRERYYAGVLIALSGDRDRYYRGHVAISEDGVNECSCGLGLEGRGER